MFSNFNEVFRTLVERNISLETEMDSYNIRNYYPNGISKRKKEFTTSELIDVYIKGNRDVFRAMLESGFGDDLGFDFEERDWFNGLLDARVNGLIY